MRLPALIAAVATTLLILGVPNAAAQRTAGSRSAGQLRAPAPIHSSSPHPNSPRTNFAIGRSSGFRRSPYLSPYSSLPFPFFGDSFDPDDIYSTGYPVAADPPPFLLQALREMPGTMGPSSPSPSENRESSSQPLMIELQNGRYVRVNVTAIDGEALPLENNNTAHGKSDAHPIPSGGNSIASYSASQVLPAALLIFRDGRSQEVRDYTIADGFLYARGDYYTDGYWNRKIDLSTLDLPRTLQANAERNVAFVLPSSPNEVVTRF